MIDNGNERKDMKKKWAILSIFITIFLTGWRNDNFRTEGIYEEFNK